MQKILFPMPTMNITTGINELSHRDSLAIDCAGEDRGIDNVHAPFTGIIKKIWPNGNTVWLESTQIVLFANGVQDYATCAFTHDNFVGDLRVGQVINQGQVFYQEGTAGNATGNHIHLEVARGKFTGSGWRTNSIGTWVLNNQIEPWKAFWLDNVRIINGHNYSWKTVQQGEDMIDQNVLNVLFKTMLGRNPDASAIAHYVGKYSTSFVVDDLNRSGERATYLKNQASSLANLQMQITSIKAELVSISNHLKSEVDLNMVLQAKVAGLTQQLAVKPTEKLVPVEVIKEVQVPAQYSLSGIIEWILSKFKSSKG